MCAFRRRFELERKILTRTGNTTLAYSQASYRYLSLFSIISVETLACHSIVPILRRTRKSFKNIHSILDFASLAIVCCSRSYVLLVIVIHLFPSPPSLLPCSACEVTREYIQQSLSSLFSLTVHSTRRARSTPLSSTANIQASLNFFADFGHTTRFD